MTEPAASVASAAPAASAAPIAPVLGDPLGAPAAPKMPEGLDPKYWNAGSVQIEPLVKDFTDLSKKYATVTERETALKARKPEDIKFEVKLPETVKLPNGPDGKPIVVGINEKDPRIPVIRDLALKNGWDQSVIDELVVLDVQQQIAAHAAEQVRVAAEDKKLGDNAAARKSAVNNWLKAATERGDFTADESKALSEYAIDAATITAFEKLIAKASGSIPGHQPDNRQPKPADVPIEQRWYPPQQKVS